MLTSCQGAKRSTSGDNHPDPLVTSKLENVQVDDNGSPVPKVGPHPLQWSSPHYRRTLTLNLIVCRTRQRC